MDEDNPHVPPTVLWGYTSGVRNLEDQHFQHLLFCLECQALVDQFIDVLDDFPAAKGPEAA
jgi:hypothetical protein